MEKYKQILIKRIEELSQMNTPFSSAKIRILLRLLEEL